MPSSRGHRRLEKAAARSGAGREYNPDFLAADVQDKRKVALLWVKTVNKAGSHGTWHYMLASETDPESATGSWAALVKATSA